VFLYKVAFNADRTAPWPYYPKRTVKSGCLKLMTTISC